MTVRLLVAALTVCVLVPPDAAPESRRGGLPRLEFEAPGGDWTVEPAVRAELPVTPETLEPSGGPPGTPAHDAGQAGPQHAGLPPQTPAGQPKPVPVPGALRGVMGYRLPLVSRQEVPDQVVSGVLIPAHTTYVILQPGYWELVGLSPAEGEALRAAAKADEPAVQSRPPFRGWNPLRLFRKNKTPAGKE